MRWVMTRITSSTVGCGRSSSRYQRWSKRAAIRTLLSARDSHPVKRTNPEAPRHNLIIFHEYELQTEVKYPVSGIPYVLTGRADWAAGHSLRGQSDSMLVCVEAKQRATFSKAERQLTAYLAIYYNERKNSGKVVPSVQGFSTDGQRFTFQLLSPGGTLHVSKTYDIVDKKEEAVRTYAQDTFWGIFDPPPYRSDSEEEYEPDLDIDAFARQDLDS
jgi:hypothetical protein